MITVSVHNEWEFDCEDSCWVWGLPRYGCGVVRRDNEFFANVVFGLHTYGLGPFESCERAQVEAVAKFMNLAGEQSC